MILLMERQRIRNACKAEVSHRVCRIPLEETASAKGLSHEQVKHAFHHCHGVRDLENGAKSLVGYKTMCAL